MPENSATSARIASDGASSEPTLSFRASGENLVIWTVWLTYGAFYFCRQNISAAVPGLKSSVADGGLALTGEQVGWILAALKIAYGLGQLINGQLSERLSPRVMLAVGMFGSAGWNVLFGFSTGFYFLLFVWAMNGYCQSLGWTPCVRVVANWIPIERRGKTMGLIGTGYQITLGLTYLIAGQAAEYFGWRGALYVPAALLALAGVYTLIFLRDAPKNGDTLVHTTQKQSPQSTPAHQRMSFSESLYWTLFNPALWLMGITLGLLNAVRYGYFDWGLAHLMETREMPVGKAVIQYFVIAIGATAGAYLAGWATDRYFGSRRAPVICILMASLGGLTLLYEPAVHSGALQTMLLLVAIGFCIIGPQVLLVGTAPADLAHRGTSAAAAGFVDFMGYVGAASGNVITGYFSSPQHGGWHLAIHIWAGWAFAGAVIMALLWNATSNKIGLLPSIAPKIAAVALLVVADVLMFYIGGLVALQVITFVAAVCVAFTVRSRCIATLAMLVAFAGLLTVFVSYVRAFEAATWHQPAAMFAYILTMIATLMILVDREGEVCA